MKLIHKIAALVVLAAAIPLATVGFLLVRINEQALEREVCGRFDQTAHHAAEAVAAEVDGKAHLFAQTAQAIPWKSLDANEARGALELLARATGGRGADLREVRQHGGAGAPVAAWRMAGAQALELARTSDPAGPGRVVLSAVTRDPAGAPTTTATTFVDYRGGDLLGAQIAVEVPLSALRARLDEVRGGAPLRILLVDRSGDLVAASPLGPKTAEPASSAVVDDVAGGGDGAARIYSQGTHAQVGAHAPVGGFGWSIAVDQDAEAALLAPRRMRRITLLGSGLAALAALGLSILFARRLTARIALLSRGARAIAQGDLTHRVGARGSDEVAELSTAFDRMGEQLAISRTEIEGWNRELEARVAARTEELRQAQAQLVEAQKLAALGQLGAGVAHEINNPLGGVIGHAQLLLANHPAGHADHEALRCIEEGARKASQVVQNLLRFSVQRKAPVYSPVDLNRVVRETITLTEALIQDQGVQLEVALDVASPRVYGDAGQLGQVVLNLIANARTATASGGRIAVRTAPDPGRGGATVTVEDTGRGIAPENRARVFEPFFTTKDEWSNVGLGLSVSFRIVTEHRGTIAFESEVGAGTRFTVFVPSRPAEAA